MDNTVTGVLFRFWDLGVANALREGSQEAAPFRPRVPAYRGFLRPCLRFARPEVPLSHMNTKVPRISARNVRLKASPSAA